MKISPRADELEAAAPSIALIGSGARAFQAATVAQQHAVERAGRLYGEGMRFVTRRLEANRRAMHEMAGCRTLPDTLSTWNEYLETTARQYAEEIEAVTGLCAAQVREATEEVQREVGETLTPAPTPVEAEA